MRESPSYIEVVVLVTKDSVLSVENFTYYCIPKISTWQFEDCESLICIPKK